MATNNIDMVCDCGAPVARRTCHKEGINKDRDFFCCPNQICRFFKSCDGKEWNKTTPTQTQTQTQTQPQPHPPPNKRQCHEDDLDRLFSKLEGLISRVTFLIDSLNDKK
jgi:hypothetical protein